MRLHFLIPLFAIFFTVALATNRDDFLARTGVYVKIWNKSQLGQLVDPILKDVCSLKTMDEIAGNVMGYALAIYASNPFAALPLLSLKSDFDKCLKPYNSDTMSMLTPLMGGVGLGLTKTYKLMKKKVQLMKSNGKSAAQCADQMNYLGKAVVTQDLVQHMLWLVMKNVTAGQWSCCVSFIPNVLYISSPPFDLTYRPTKWIYPYKK